MSENHGGISTAIWDDLYAQARAIRENAYAPYSKFKVGAALLLKNGEIVLGCNVENATYGATSCAERTAVQNAVTQGNLEFAALVVVTPAQFAVAPCGICRQVIAEVCDDDALPIMAATVDGDRLYSTLGELLPMRFRGTDILSQPTSPPFAPTTAPSPFAAPTAQPRGSATFAFRGA